MSTGTEQRERGLHAFTDHRFEVDELSLDRRVDLSARLARCLRFVDLNNREVGSWSGLFDNDESLVLARIAAFDGYAWRQDFVQECEAAAPEHLALKIMKLAQLMDRWHQNLGGSATASVRIVRDALAQIVTRHLASQLAWVRHGVVGDSRRLNLSHEVLQARLWSVPDAATAEPLGARGAESVKAPVAAATATPPRERLRSVAFSLLNAIARVQTLARERLLSSLTQGSHEPAAGLLLAFLRLYESVQTQVNGFGDRQIDFYYRDVLGLRPRPTRADQVQVLCQRDARHVGELELPAGARFIASPDASGRAQAFVSTQALSVGDAQVVEWVTLLQRRDPKVAPESELGYVSSVWAQRVVPALAQSVPVFGGGAGSQVAALGLAVASPLLHLAEGERSVKLELVLAWPGQTLAQHAERALELADTAGFLKALGAVFAHWLLGDDGTLSADLLRRLQARQERGACAQADAIDDHSALARLWAGSPEARRSAFFKYVNSLFQVSLSGAQGWHVVERAQFDLPSPDSGGGFGLKVFLRHDDPAVVGCDPGLHGREWRTALPLLRLQVSPQARLHPCSLLDGADFVAARLEVAARGVRGLLMHNQLGALDAGKGFAPFGPLPTTSSQFVFGSPEAACKALSSLSVHMRWSGLPADSGAWAAHYEAYAADQTQGQFIAELALLRDGRWLPCGGRSARQPLFATPDAGGRLRAAQSFSVDEASVRAHCRASVRPMTSSMLARDGLVRLQLKGPPGAFGHAAYANLLSQAAGQRTRRGRARAMPRLPYTPELESLSIDYSASAALTPGRPEAAEDAERLMHIHPFGVADLPARSQTEGASVLPALGPDGGLCLGLRARSLEGPLTLLFRLQSDGAQELQPGQRRQPIVWSLLVDDVWQPLNDRHVLSDTTFGLLCSGIVTLDLPSGASKDNRTYGGGLYWLRVGSSGLLGTAAPLLDVQAQALTLQRELGSALEPVAPLAGGLITRPERSVPGLGAVAQPDMSSGLRAAESQQQMRVRAGERLRHKNRASRAWDFERLVLEHFPEVFKVRCLAAGTAGLGAGQVLVVVVPRVTRNDAAAATRAPRLDGLTLQRIRQFLSERASEFVALEVRNAVYERVQVRCSVLAQAQMPTGALRRRLDSAFTEYLSPWFDVGLGPRFDWLVRCEDIEALARRTPGVAAVSGVSLLHVTRTDQGRYRLGDTARGTGPAGSLRHGTPWGLALPLAGHLIDFVASDAQAGRMETAEIAPSVTGLQRLRIGETLVIGRRGQA